MKIDCYFLEKDFLEAYEKIKECEKEVILCQDIPKYAERADQLLKKVKQSKEYAEMKIDKMRLLKAKIRSLS